jgi:hypothetical protein
LEKILTLENTDKIIRNLEICAGTLFNPSNTGEGCMLTGVEHVGNADFYNTLSKISKLPFQNNGIELLM